ncbi:hypothetical protein CTAYLR_009129 [Chrysophaeum taylorii]|uniref:Uncharacterized protein n=1 Tax=Chrysophaeum taylorii TaxID=2483200 RepID=A0AAD7UL03_9STRA|nr:hypothetical protein CTAYLR_009129 [Chrysophaeum taylorii]
MVGAKGVGKSSLVEVFVFGASSRGSREVTLEDSFHRLLIVDGSCVMLELVDTSWPQANDRATVMATADGFVLVFSLLDARSFNNLAEAVGQIHDVHPVGLEAPTVLVGTKLDLAVARGRFVATDEAKAHADRLGAAYFETSARDPTTVEPVFVAVVRAVLKASARTGVLSHACASSALSVAGAGIDLVLPALSDDERNALLSAAAGMHSSDGYVPTRKLAVAVNRKDMLKALDGDAIQIHRLAVAQQEVEKAEDRRAEMNHEELVADAAQFRGDMTSEQAYELLERNARGEPMRFVEIPKDSPLRPSIYRYRVVYPHPLPFDHEESRLENDVVMRRIQHLLPRDRCWHAVISNKPWCVEELYLTGFPIDAANESGMTPMHLASHLGYKACVEILVNAGAYINAQTLAGVTPLESARAAGHADIEDMLRANGAVVQKRRYLMDRRTILDVAADRIPRGRPTAFDDVATALKRPLNYGFPF